MINLINSYWVVMNVISHGILLISDRLSNVILPDISPPYTVSFLLERSTVYSSRIQFCVPLMLAIETHVDYLNTRSDYPWCLPELNVRGRAMSFSSVYSAMNFEWQIGWM